LPSAASAKIFCNKKLPASESFPSYTTIRRASQEGSLGQEEGESASSLNVYMFREGSIRSDEDLLSDVSSIHLVKDYNHKMSTISLDSRCPLSVFSAA